MFFYCNGRYTKILDDDDDDDDDDVRSPPAERLCTHDNIK